MSSQDLLKSFVSYTKEYQSSSSDDAISNLLRCAQVLGASSDLYLCDAASKEIVEFFVSLHELMLMLDPKSNLPWACLNILKAACRNIAIRDSLIHTYKFTAILTKMLAVQQSIDKRIQILHLLQELTYGIKIMWQESYLKQLITLLTGWITGANQELSSVSLEILINLCYKNVPSIYTLMKIVDTKQFLRLLLNSQQTDQHKMQLCKLLITLESIYGSLPESEMKVYVKLTCPSLIEAIKSNNVYHCRHIHNYFQEIMNNPRVNNIVEDYEKLVADVCVLLQELTNCENSISVDCLGVCFEFLTTIIETAGKEKHIFDKCLPDIITLALRWIHTAEVSARALTLITATVLACSLPTEMDCSDGGFGKVCFSEKALDFVKEQLNVILLLLNNGNEGSFSICNESYSKQSALLNLLTQMMEVPALASKLVESLNKEVFNCIFAPLTLPVSNKGKNLFLQPVYTFYIQALSLLTVLANYDSSWYFILSERLKEKQILMVLAIALYTAPEQIKNQALKLIKSKEFPTTLLGKLSGCLVDVNKLMVFATSPMNSETSSLSDLSLTPLDINHLLTLTQEGYLNSVLERCEKSMSQSANGMTSSIMELYQYKMASMSHTLRVMQVSQEAADSRVTKLQHCLAMTSAEVSRLHHLLHATQQSVEVKSKNLVVLTARIADKEAESSKWKNKFQQMEQTMKSKTRIIDEQTQELKAAKENLMLLEKQSKEFEESMTAEKKKLTIDLNKEVEINKELTSLINNSKEEILNLNAVNKNLEKVVAEKEQSVTQLNHQLQMILDLAASATNR